MTPRMFWIDGPWRGRLAISARPRGGDWLEDEVRGWCQAGVDTLVSLLEEGETHELGLADEGRLARLNAIRFIPFPTPDRGVPPSWDTTAALFRDLGRDLESGKNVAVHCRQGIGRSSLIAAGALIAAGIEPESALRTVSTARGLPVPETPEQRRRVEKERAGHLVFAG